MKNGHKIALAFSSFSLSFLSSFNAPITFEEIVMVYEKFNPGKVEVSFGTMSYVGVF